MATDAAPAASASNNRGPLRAAVRGRRVPASAAHAVAAVALQVAYPLVGGAARERLIPLIVLVFAGASSVHAVATRGWRVGGGAITVALAGGFAAEVLGLHIGVPFGDYAYRTLGGPRVAGVPLAVVLAWAMLAWPAALVARRLARGYLARVAVGAWALAAWDLYLDPQMVAAGAWRWRDPNPHLPGVPDVPLTNFAGWLLVATLISLAGQWLLRHDAGGRDGGPIVLYLWTWLGSALALAAFLHRPAAAAWGAGGMGLIAIPLVRSRRR